MYLLSNLNNQVLVLANYTISVTTPKQPLFKIVIFHIVPFKSYSLPIQPAVQQVM